MAVCLSVALTSEASAADTVQVAIVDPGDAALGRQLGAEASYAGFSVTRAAEAATRAGEPPPAARIVILSSDRVELELLGPDGSTRAGGELARVPGDENAFALRVVEHLRARLVDLGWSLPSEPSSSAAPPESPAAAAPDPILAPEPASSRRAEAVIEDLEDTESDTPDAPSRLWLGAGAAASSAAGGLGLVPHAMLGARFEPTSRWGLSLDVFVPLAAGEIEGGEGSARSSWYALIAGAELSLLRRAPWFASLGIGGGVLLLDVSAEGRAGFSARDDRLFAGAAQLGLSAGWHLAEHLRLRADAHTGLSGPRPVLRFDGREVASLGRWYGGVGLALEGALELGAEPSP